MTADFDWTIMSVISFPLLPVFFFLVVSLLCESNKTHFTHYNLVRDNGWRVGVLVWCESKAAKDVSHL